MVMVGTKMYPRGIERAPTIPYIWLDCFNIPVLLIIAYRSMGKGGYWEV